MHILARRHILTAAVATAAGAAFGHGFHASFTVVELNPRTGALEILHRIFIQDLELILTARLGQPTRLADEPRSEKLIEDYLRRVFSLKAGDGGVLKPDWVGMKLEIDTAFIYQEVPRQRGITELSVTDQILTETNDGQVNSVNVTIGGRTRTAVFMANDPAQTIKF